MLAVDRIRHLLDYDRDTGALTWKSARGSRSAGSRAGRISQGYRWVKVDREEYKAANLIWLLVTGKWPSVLVDHKNTDRADDRWANLREATHSQNHANTHRRRDNVSGHKGVSWSKERKNWLANIRVAGKSVNLGRFNCPAAAHFSYIIAADKHFGEYARSA